MAGDLSFLTASLANPFGTPSQGEWNLQNGSFTTESGKSVTFLIVKGTQSRAQQTAVEQITDGGGRRLAVYEYPYIDGQRLQGLGRKGDRFSFNIKFVGLNHQELLKRFIDVCLNSGERGTLSHPVRGNVTCQFQDYEFLHQHSEWNSVTIRATFLEDNTGAIQAANLKAASPNSALRSALQGLNDLQGSISAAIFAASSALLLPAAITNALQARLKAVSGSFSALLGQLAATFSTDVQIQSLMASAASAGGVTSLNDGVTTDGSTLPPVYQVGFSDADQANILAQRAAFVGANQVSPQAAVFSANQVRAQISKAIAEASENLGNAGFDIVLGYRAMAVQVQDSTQSAITSAQSKIKVVSYPVPMSLRMVAFRNGLSPDQQNAIAALNPYLPSLNYLPANTEIVVPAA